MLTYSKIGILVLYPLVTFVLPFLTFGTILGDLKEGTNVGGSVTGLVSVNMVLSFTLLILSLYFVYQSYKSQLFKKGADGNNKATVSDYFAIVFAAFVLVEILTTLFKSLT
jgi:hypothetical protein